MHIVAAGVYLTSTVRSGGLTSAGSADVVAALGPVSGNGPVVVFANDGTSSGLYFVNDFGQGGISGSNIRLMGLYQDAVIAVGDILGA